MNITPSIAASSVSVRAAFRDSGLRNAGTPLAIASTPVMAVQPPANARKTRNRLTPSMAGGIGCSGGGRPAINKCTVPTTSSRPMLPTNRYVGSANAAPASQVDVDEDGDEADVDEHPMRVEGWPDCGESSNAGRHRHGDGGEVVDHQRSCCGEPSIDAEVFP